MLNKLDGGYTWIRPLGLPRLCPDCIHEMHPSPSYPYPYTINLVEGKHRLYDCQYCKRHLGELLEERRVGGKSLPFCNCGFCKIIGRLKRGQTFTHSLSDSEIIEMYGCRARKIAKQKEKLK